MPEVDAVLLNAAEISVSELSNALKRTLEDRFGFVRVRGEISGYKGAHASGHVYFSLKDAGARLDAVIWKTTFARMRVKPEEGLDVVASGKITTFAGKSAYQIVVDLIEAAGVGALMALLERRRRQLASEGLFDNSRKRALPYLPRIIGIVTSPSGAVIRDILHRLADRFPVRVIIWPVRVQGEIAAEEIVAAIRGFNTVVLKELTIPRPDVLIVARGGGSLEDLWSFNEEAVVRAVAASEIPLVSAVGHETDWTLIDHAADLRAPTPTAAAEFCVPVRSDLILRAAALSVRIAGAQSRMAKRDRTNLRSLVRGLPNATAILSGPSQRQDAAATGLTSRLRSRIGAETLRISDLARRLARFSPHAQLIGAFERTRALASRLGYFGKAPASKARLGFAQAQTGLAREVRIDFDRRDDKMSRLESRWSLGRSAVCRLATAGKADSIRVADRLRREIFSTFQRKHTGIVGISQLFATVNYKAVLARGYAMVQDRSGAPLASAEGARTARYLRVRFHDGEITANAAQRKGAGHRKYDPSDAAQQRLI